MHPFLEAMFRGDVLYHDVVCNIKRDIFVDCTGMQQFTINIHMGHSHYTLFTNGYTLMAQLRRLGISFEQGWSVYNAKSRSF